MKINNEFLNTIRPGETGAGKAAAPTAVNTATRPAETAGRVQISDASRTLQVGAGEAPFDAKRVDEIKAAIASGTFKVNADAVAGKLLDSVSQLLADKA